MLVKILSVSVPIVPIPIVKVNLNYVIWTKKDKHFLIRQYKYTNITIILQKHNVLMYYQSVCHKRLERPLSIDFSERSTHRLEESLEEYKVLYRKKYNICIKRLAKSVCFIYTKKAVTLIA